MIAFPASCLPAQITPIEIFCSVYSGQNEEDLMTITYETISKNLMISPITALKNRISEISHLNYNWNGEGSVVPSEQVIKNAFKFLDCILILGYTNYLKPEDIVPTPYGTIDMDFETGQGLVSVEIGKDQIGFFTEYERKEDVLSDGIKTDFRNIPKNLQQALSNLEEQQDANAISA